MNDIIDIIKEHIEAPGYTYTDHEVEKLIESYCSSNIEVIARWILDTESYRD